MTREISLTSCSLINDGMKDDPSFFFYSLPVVAEFESKEINDQDFHYIQLLLFYSLAKMQS